MDAYLKKNIELPAIDFSPNNLAMLSPTTLPAKVVAEVFSISRPSRKFTSIAAGSPPNGSDRWQNYLETPMISVTRRFRSSVRVIAERTTHIFNNSISSTRLT